jgi:O-antigen ligase
LGALLLATGALVWWLTTGEAEWIRERYSVSFQAELEEERGSTFIRLIILEGVWRAWLENMWFGIGGGNFLRRSAEFVQLPLVEAIQPHNTYLGLMAELGLLGLAGILLILLPPIFRISRTSSFPMDLRIGIGVAYSVALAHLITFDGLARYGLWILLGFCSAVVHRGPIRKLALH